MKFFHSILFNLRSEIRHVGLLPFQSSLGHEHGKVAVLDPHLLDLPVEEVDNGLPNFVRPRTEDVATAHIVVLNHFGLRYDLENGTQKIITNNHLC